jgi:hypothetical protein
MAPFDRRGCIGGASEAETTQTDSLALQIFNRILDPDVMCVEETVNLIAGLKAEQSSEIRFGEMAVLVLFRNQRFQSATRQVPAHRTEALGDVVGDLHGQLHILTLLPVVNAADAAILFSTVQPNTDSYQYACVL